MLDLSVGARNAVRTCLAVGPGERVLIVSDEARSRIGKALAEEVEAVGGEPKVLLIEEFTSRPATGYPSQMQEQVATFDPQVSIFAATALEGELALRAPLMQQVIYDMKVRHGHMVGIDEQLMVEGMTADYQEIARITHKVNEAVKHATEIEVTAPSGTDMRARFDPSKRRWHPCPGLYHSPGQWGNLPEGETFTSPMSVDGVIGAEVLGDHFSHKYGVLDTPVELEVAGGRVKQVRHADDVLRSELETYLSRHENSNRAGEYAIGTNVALSKLSGNLLQDEKVPGVHVAFGHPYPNETGADWECPTHIDVVATRSTIKVDGQVIMRDGKFTI